MAKKDTSHTTRNVAIGAVVAGAVGYVAGILTAPKSGKETRKDIHRAALKAKRQAEQKLKKLHSELDDLIEQGRSTTVKLSAKAKTELNAAIDLADKAKHKVRDILSAIHEGDAEDKDLDMAVKEATKAVEHLRSFLTKNAQTKSK